MSFKIRIEGSDFGEFALVLRRLRNGKSEAVTTLTWHPDMEAASRAAKEIAHVLGGNPEISYADYKQVAAERQASRVRFAAQLRDAIARSRNHLEKANLPSAVRAATENELTQNTQTLARVEREMEVIA